MASDHARKRRKLTGQLQVKDLVWDRTTYRIRNIPREFTRPRLSLVVTEVLGVRASEVKIHSLASYDYGEPSDKVATVSFRQRPGLLPPPLKEWHFNLVEDDDTGRMLSLIFDTRFNNFTPLSFSDKPDVSQDDKDIE